MPPDPIPPDPSIVSPQGGMDPSLTVPNPAVPVLAGSPGSMESAGPPRMGRPILMDLIAGLVHPKMQAAAPGQMARPVSRLDTFESFLGNFIGALGTGLANAGHGPGANLRGAGTAITAPYNQAVQQYGLQQQAAAQQAQTQGVQARTAQTQAQTAQMGSMVTLPDGTQVPYGIAGKALPAEITAQGRRDVANTNAIAKVGVEQMKFFVQSGQVAKVMPAQDADGKFVMRAYNKQGTILGDMDGAVPPAAYLPKTSSTVEYKQQDDGSFVALPKQTTTGVVMGLGGKGSGKAAVRPGTKIVAQPVMGPGGAPIHGKGGNDMMTGSMPDGSQVAGNIAELNASGATGITKLPAQVQTQVSQARQLTSPGGLFDSAEKDLAAFKPGEFEKLAPRWNEFMAGTYGTADPRYVALRTDVNGLLSTAIMQAHVGNRGSSDMREHFEDLANTGKMSAGTLKAALSTERRYIEHKAMKVPSKAAPGSEKVDALAKKYGG